MSERIEGGCRCGAVRFEATGAPIDVAWCHCESCRKHSGAPVSVFVAIPHDAYKVTKGEITKFNSSPGRWRGFCARSGRRTQGADRLRPDCGLSPRPLWGRTVLRHHCPGGLLRQGSDGGRCPPPDAPRTGLWRAPAWRPGWRPANTPSKQSIAVTPVLLSRVAN
jgi:hypothetical protein